MFWQATTTSGNAVPGSVMQNVNDPTSFNRSHPRKQYPETGMLPMMPDRVTLKIHLQAIGDDVLADLVAVGRSRSGDPAARSPATSWAGRRRSSGRRRPRSRRTIRPPAPRCCAWSSRSPTGPTSCPRSATRAAPRRRSRSAPERAVCVLSQSLFSTRDCACDPRAHGERRGQRVGPPAMRSGARRRRVRRQPARGVRGRVAALSSLRRSRADAAAGCVRRRQRPRRARDRMVRRRDDARHAGRQDHLLLVHARAHRRSRATTPPKADARRKRRWRSTRRCCPTRTS